MMQSGGAKGCPDPEAGFTLLEVLVALVITGLTVTVFLQLLSAGMRLEYRSLQRTQEIMDLEQALNKVLVQDVREDDFQWEGELGQGSWSLDIEPVQTRMQEPEDEEQGLQMPKELYRYVFTYSQEKGREWRVERYVLYDPDFFSDEFKRLHFD